MVKTEFSKAYESYLDMLCYSFNPDYIGLKFNYNKQVVTITFKQGKKTINVDCCSNAQVAIDVIRAIM